MPVTALTLQRLLFNNLAASLVFKLVIFTEKFEAETTSENPSPMVPNSPFTLDTLSIPEETRACVRLETLPPVTHPRLAEVTDGSHHLHAGGVGACMLDDAVPRLHHALLLPTLGAHGESLDRPTKVAEGAVLLSPVAFVADHVVVARLVSHTHFLLATLLDLLLPQLHLVVLLPSSRLLLRHLSYNLLPLLL